MGWPLKSIKWKSNNLIWYLIASKIDFAIFFARDNDRHKFRAKVTRRSETWWIRMGSLKPTGHNRLFGCDEVSLCIARFFYLVDSLLAFLLELVRLTTKT